QHIYAKALVIDDNANGRIVIVTLDLIGVPRQLRDRVEQRVRQQYGLAPESLLLNASHTHSGPAPSAEGVNDPIYAKKADAYQRLLADKIVQVIGEALSRSGPADLYFTRARAGFAMNRRLRVGHEIRNSPNPNGPVDHDVPVLRVVGSDGELKAVLFGYACHNTVTGFYTINGDYAGYAQAYLEQAHPRAVALFLMGAGGDQNPYPRHSSLDQSAQHGRTLANAVETAMEITIQRTVRGPLRKALGYATLAYANTSPADSPPHTGASDTGEGKGAGAPSKKHDAPTRDGGYPCPVQVVQFGADVTLVAIGGETTVDYSLRLKRELRSGPAAVWVAGYSNDGFGYLGSRRVIVEGGYEGYSANLRRHPAPWATDTEERVIQKVYELMQSINH
ncbi:MAG: neutral/alkaline non-lysosomal ceramidase N-terminal domain-containing protein, partial [Vicinamibacteraceae bacterium]